MALLIRKALIVYCSPAGSTKHVALVMERKLRSLEIPVTVLDLGGEPDIPFIVSQLPSARDNLCLYIGSPVYALHPLPPVMDFIACLPPAKEGYSIPFVTWGGVSSGTALLDMGKALEERGYRLLGAAKVLAPHSRMWALDTPLGKGHPDGEDDAMVEELVLTVNGKLKLGQPPPLPLNQLDYQTRELRDLAGKMSFETARASFPPVVFKETQCTLCGLCAELCPMGAITLSPYPKTGPSCISCWNCVRYCPEGALTTDLTKTYERIRDLAAMFKEGPLTRIFV